VVVVVVGVEAELGAGLEVAEVVVVVRVGG
jgi:hypothetical protein